MKKMKIFLAVTAAINLAAGSYGYAADGGNRQTAKALGQLFASRDLGISFSLRDAKLFLAADSDRGCCLWRTDKGACTYTSEGFCRAKAMEANVRFEFYLNKSCRELTVCK